LSLRPSYIALGPIFETTCKSMSFGPQGMSRIQEWKELCPEVPLVAIGGLQLDHGPALLAHGADGISVVSDVLANPRPEERTRAWLKLWNERRLGINFFGSSVVRP
jgi:thiamine monophosphate synthase